MLNLPHAHLENEHFYASLPVCVTDTVFAPGVLFTAVLNVIARYCSFAHVRRIRPDRTRLPDRSEQESISRFCARLRDLGSPEARAKMFGNRQRTCTKNGILKAEAVLRFAEALGANGIEYLQEMVDLSPARERTVRARIETIPGQRNTWDYFRISAGSDDQVIATRMIQRFTSTALGHEIGLEEARDVVYAAAGQLQTTYPHVTGRLLDFTIWNYQRQPASNLNLPAIFRRDDRLTLEADTDSERNSAANCFVELRPAGAISAQ